MGNSFEADIPNMTEKLLILDELLCTRLGWEIVGESKVNAPVGKNTWVKEQGVHKEGLYRDTIDYDEKSRQVIAHASYSACIEYGTRPHEIKPTPVKKFLHFFIRGKEIFAKKVQHPGTKPNPVMRNSARTVLKRDFDRTFKACWDYVMKDKK